MAFSISTSVPLITPVYAPIEFTLADPSADYMELEIYIGDASKATSIAGTKRVVRIVSTSVTADIQGILQPFFQSDASVNPDFKRFDVYARSVIGDASTTTYINNYFTFNGVKRDTWDFEPFMMDGSGNRKFLNNFNADIDIHYANSNPRLFFFQGDIGNSTGTYYCSAPSFKINVDGVATAGYQFATDTTPRIQVFNVDPSSLSLSSSVKQYTIDPSQNTTNFGLKTYNIIPQDGRYTPRKVTWIDSMGCLNSFWFDLAKLNNVEVARSTFNNNGIIRQYNTQNKDKYTLTSNWIDEKQSAALKDLWYAPSVMVDGKYAILSNKQVRILNRREIKLINYEMDYELSDQYNIQLI